MSSRSKSPSGGGKQLDPKSTSAQIQNFADKINTGTESLVVDTGSRKRRTGLLMGSRSTSSRSLSARRGRSNTGKRGQQRRSSSVNNLHALEAGGSRAGGGLDNLGSPPKGSTRTPAPYVTRQESLEDLEAEIGANSYHAGPPLAGDSAATLDRVFDDALNPHKPGRGRSPMRQLEMEREEDPIDANKSLFEMRGEKDLRAVDQSVNLMDAEAGNYGKKKKKPPRQSVMEFMFGSRTGTASRINTPNHRKPGRVSLEDIDLGPDPSKRRMTHFYLQQRAAEQDNPWSKCWNGMGKAIKPIRKFVCSAPFLAAVVIIIMLIFWIPYIQDKVNRMPASPPTTEAPDTPEPTQVPKTPEPTAPPPARTVRPKEEEEPAQEDAVAAMAPPPKQEEEEDATTHSASGELEKPQEESTDQKAMEHSASAMMTPSKEGEGTTEEAMTHSASGELEKPQEEKPSLIESVMNFFSPSKETDDGSDDQEEEETNNDESPFEGMPPLNDTYFSPQEQAHFEEMLLRMVEIQGLVLARGLTSMEDLHNSTSPQNKALDWMITTAQNDEERRRRLKEDDLEDQEDQRDPDTRTVQRYVAAVLFFSFHSLAEIDQMYDQLYYSQAIDHVWSDADLYVHGYGCDGVPIGNGSQCYNESYLNYYHPKPIWNESECEEHSWNKSDFPHNNDTLNTTGRPPHRPENTTKPEGPENKPGDGEPPRDGPGPRSTNDTGASTSSGPQGNGTSPPDGQPQSNVTKSPAPSNQTTGQATGAPGGSPRTFSLFTPHSSKTAEGGGRQLRNHHPPSPHRRLDSLLHGKWMSDKDICKWKGIECDGRNQVTKLDLSKHHMKGSIPSEIVGFEWLTQVDLSENHLLGSIPSEIGTLEFLQELLLHENKLTGEVPTTFKDNPLVILRLSHNHLNGQIPTELTKLMDLKEIWLNHNSLNGTLPAALEGLVTLQKLHAEGNSLSGTIPEFLSNGASLLTVRLHHNNFSGSIPESLCNAITNYGLHFLSSDCKSKVVCDCCHECF